MVDQSMGKIIQVTGPVVDVQFGDLALPDIYDALEVETGENILVLEVQQHLGNDRVRCLAMDTTDGMARGLAVRKTGAPITVPVGTETLGRVSTFWDSQLTEWVKY